MMDTSNYILTALPSYVRYSRRELGKLSKEDRRESAFSGIRQKLSSAVISVPYGGGLDNLRLIGNLDDHEFQNRFSSYKKPKRNKHKNKVVSDTELLMSDGDMSPTKTYRYHDQFSPTKLHFTGRKPARIGSETSTTSTATSKSRSTIYSTSDADDGYWAKKLKELEEVKERYSDNSEFLTSLYGYKLKKEKHKKKKKSKVKRDDESTPASMVDDISNRLVLPPIHQKHHLHGHSAESLEHSRSRTPSEHGKTREFSHSDRNKDKENVHSEHGRSKETTHRKGRENLHSEHSKTFESSVQGRSRESSEHSKYGESSEIDKSRENTLTNPSDESNTSTIVADDDNEVFKRRKVEFNFQKAKQNLKLPPIEGKLPKSPKSPRVKNPKRSILKKINKNSNNVNSFPANANPPNASWQSQMGKLKSPVPSSASRRQQVTFKRNPFNMNYKCSKEFETVATNYENDRKPSFLTE